MDNNRKVVELPLEDVLPNRFQPRIKFSEDAINELSESIKEHGVIQPIVVRPVGDRYEIIAGERRFKATTLAGLQTIPAIIINLNDKESAEVALIENVQRQDLTPIEEAISYKKILDMGYLNQENLAGKIGKSQSSIANKLRLLNLDEEVQEALLNGKISERHARSLLKLTNKEEQVELLNKIIKERLTVRKTDEEINKMLNGSKEEINKQNEVEVLSFDEPIIIPSEEVTTKFNIPTNPIIEENNNDRQEESFVNPFMNVSMPEINNDSIKIDEEDNIPSFSDLIMNKNQEVSMEEQPSSFFTNNFNDVDNTQNVDFNNYKFNDTLVPNDSESVNTDFTLSPNFGIPNFDDSIFNNELPVTNQTNINENIVNDNLVVGNMKDVITSFRECEKQISNQGFVVDTEEFDLDDIYQVVFKVHKK